MKRFIVLLILFQIYANVFNQDIGSLLSEYTSKFKAKVYIFGGGQCVDGYHEISNLFIHNLNDQFGMTKVIETLPPSYVYFINQYSKNKNDSIFFFLLNKTNDITINCTYRIINVINIINEIPDIRFFSISYEYPDLVTFYALNTLIGNLKLSDEFDNSLKLIKSILASEKVATKRQILELSINLNNILNTNDKYFRDKLGNDYIEYKMIVNGLYYSLNFPIRKKRIKNFNIREETYYSNFVEIMDEYPNEVFYAELDGLHICKKKVKKWIWLENWESLAAKLNNNPNSKAQNNVTSIVYYTRLRSQSEDDFYGYGILNPELRNEIFGESDERFSIYNIHDVKYDNYSNYFDLLIIDREWKID